MHQMFVEFGMIGTGGILRTHLPAFSYCDVIRLAEDPFQSLGKYPGRTRGWGPVWGKLSHKEMWLASLSFPGSIWWDKLLQRSGSPRMCFLLEVAETLRSSQRTEEPTAGFSLAPCYCCLSFSESVAFMKICNSWPQTRSRENRFREDAKNALQLPEGREMYS